jgi:hypothetical protein
MPKSSSKKTPNRRQTKSDKPFMRIKELKPNVIPTRPLVEQVYQSMNDFHRTPGSDLDVYTTLVPFETGISSDSSGNVSNVFSNDPNNSAYWTTIVSNFEQYRVLGVKFSFVPNTIHGGTVTIYKSPFVYVTDFDSSAVLTSYGLARTFSNCREIESTKRFSILAVEDDSSQAGWNDVATNPPSNPLWIKFFGTGFTASTPLGRVTIDYVVQFKNRGV